MPAHLIPHKSGLHRIAAIALYRALLTQAQRCPLPSLQRHELQNVVRTRFKHARFDTSQRQLKIRFAAGYEALDILDTAVAERKSDTVESLLQGVPDSAKQIPVTVLPKALRREREGRERRARQGEVDAARARRTSALFARPLPLEKLSGARHVPVLFRANFVPVLRVKKPQPAALSRYIRQRVQSRQRRHDRKQQLEAELRVAKWEDTWDNIVGKLEGVRDSEGGKNVEDVRGEGKWTHVLHKAIDQVLWYMRQEAARLRAMATKMQGVVDRERILYDQEKLERHRKKREAFFAKHAAKREKKA
nr:hypothetical protein CFP56_00691 [Quercus suber]